ncbi:hypothetical protein GCM10009872_62240 [Actinopolymorpha rutila]
MRCGSVTDWGWVVTAIWSVGAEGWVPLSPTGFPNEKALHELVANAPDLLT